MHDYEIFLNLSSSERSVPLIQSVRRGSESLSLPSSPDNVAEKLSRLLLLELLPNRYEEQFLIKNILAMSIFNL